MKKLLLFGFALAAFSAQAQFWTQKSTGFATTSRGIDDISIVNDNVIWVKAYDGTAAASPTVKEYSLSTDGGNTWTPKTMNLGLGTNGLGISSLTAVSETTAWITAYFATGGVGGVFKTTNGNAASPSWTRQTTAAFGADSFPNLVYFWDENNGVCQGDPQGGYFEVYTTSNGGTTWTRVPSADLPPPLADEYGYVHNYDVVGDTFWFGTSKGRLYKSTDKGLHWTVSQSPLGDFGSATESGNYSFSDQNKGIMNSAAGNLYNTSDGGVTWSPVIPNGVFGNNDIEYIPGSSIIVSTGGATGYGSYYSLNDGMTWLPAEEATQFTSLKFSSTTTGFAGGFTTSPTAGGIYKYTGTQLATAHFSGSTLKVYPNPSTGVYNLTGTPVSQITVIDLLGKQVFNSKYSAVSDLTVDLSSLERGVYMMSIKNDLGESKTVKIMKN